jgi:predicted HNH restriction endonuclease
MNSNETLTAVELYPDEVAEGATFPEGAVRNALVNAYERNPIARRRCIEHYGRRCAVCDLSFESRYGAIGRGFIHVHHLRSLSDIGREYQVDPVADLRPVCPNCHAMLHRRSPPFTIEELRTMLRVE